MPFTTPPAASADAADASSLAGGRAQGPTAQAAKKEHELGAASASTARRPRRREPAACSSSSSSNSSSGARAGPHSAAAADGPHVHHHRERSLRLHVGVFSKRKGVRYNADGRVVKCRFCEILRDRDEPFLYEDELLVVFRPLHPIVPSHILIVPRAHIRNVNQLNVDHVALLRRMRAVADRVLHTHRELQAHQPSNQHQGSTSSEDEQEPTQTKQLRGPKSPTDVSAAAEACAGLAGPADIDDEPSHDDTDCRFAFHVPPFNSIDHVHMHAFRGDTGYFGRIKYRTESWWCRSYDEVLARLETQQQHPPMDGRRPQAAPPPIAPVACS